LSIEEVDFGSFIVERSNFRVVLFRGEVVLAQAEVDYLELPSVFVDEDIKGLNIPMHDASRVNIVEPLHQLKYTRNSSLI
jgi:hypothetical protein